MSGASASPDHGVPNERDAIRIRRALVSVSDKTGLLALGRALAEADVEIVSTGSTAAALSAAGIPVTTVESVTGFAEALDGRVRTLHPSIHGGLLADLRRDGHRDELAALGIRPFELLVSSLYPFEAAVASGARSEDIIEQVDIGGPAMVRAAAKNHANVAVVTDPSGYPQVLKALLLGGTTLAQRQRLAVEAFLRIAEYDAAIAGWFEANIGLGARRGSGGNAHAEHPDTATSPDSAPFPAVIDLEVKLALPLRYGENSHQAGALYVEQHGVGVAQATQLGGKEMSFNNYVDADAAVRAAFDFTEPAVAIIKHANPCGIAVARGPGDAIASAHARANACDPVSAYGGVVASNRMLTAEAARSIAPIFTEVVIAPDYEPAALDILLAKKNLRVLRLPAGYRRSAREIRPISGGALVQSTDTFEQFSSGAWTLVSGPEADAATRADLEFAWRAVRAVKSNAILLAHDGASVGVGMGQVNRVDSCRLALARAADRASGSVAASDAFFPFADGLQILLDAGVVAVVQPGGSIRDPEVIEAAERASVTMYFTAERHFAH